MANGGSVADLAEILGISVRAVGKFCAQGRISFSSKNGKRWFPDLQAAAQEYLASRDIGRGQRRANETIPEGNPPGAVGSNGALGANNAAGENARAAFGAAPDDEKIESYSKSAARLQHYKAAMAEIEYQIEIGALVKKDEMDRDIFNFHRTIRDQFLNIPDRLAAVLAAETEQVKIHAIMTKEIRRVLSALADEADAQ